MIVRAERAADFARSPPVVERRSTRRRATTRVADLPRMGRRLPAGSRARRRADGRGRRRHVMFTSPSSRRGDDAHDDVAAGSARTGSERGSAPRSSRRAAPLLRPGEPVVIVEGDPRYYSRFGGDRARELGLDGAQRGEPEAAFQEMRYRTTQPAGRAGTRRPTTETCNTVLLGDREGRGRRGHGRFGARPAQARSSATRSAELTSLALAFSAESAHGRLLFIGRAADPL